MVKWYTSLFITKNTTVLTDASIDLLVFPWAIWNDSPKYYGLGVQLMFASDIWTSPTTTAPPPVMVFYLGGSQCAFFSIVVWNSSSNPFFGGSLATYPVTTAVARNNRMVNVSQETFAASQTAKNMNWFTANMEVPFASWNGLFTDPEWFDGSCCAPFGSSLSDTLYVAWNLLFTVAAYPFCDIYGLGATDDNIFESIETIVSVNEVVATEPLTSLNSGSSCPTYPEPVTPWNFDSGSEQVWYGDNLWYENYVGNRSYEYGIPFDYDTQFPICSNTKLLDI
jgi:hypothetical protein